MRGKGSSFDGLSAGKSPIGGILEGVSLQRSLEIQISVSREGDKSLRGHSSQITIWMGGIYHLFKGA